MHSIWVPSLQQFVRFDSFTTGDQLNLAKTIELELTKTPCDFDAEFISILARKTKQLTNVNTLTVLDKLLISIQFAINCVSHTINKTYVCPKCGVTTVNKIAVASIYQKLQTYIDKNYRCRVKHKDVDVCFDVMSLGKQLIFDTLTADGDKTIANDIEPLQWIETVSFRGQHIDIQSLELSHMRLLCRQLPVSVLTQAKTMIRFHAMPKPIAQVRCASCAHTQLIDFVLANINDLVTTLLQLNAATVYDELFKLKTNGAIGSIEDGLKLAPIERTVFLKMLQANEPKTEQSR